MANNAKDYFDTGRQYFKNKKYDKAIEQFKLALQCKDATLDQKINSQFELGRCYFEQDLFDEARTHFQEYGHMAKKLKNEQSRITKQTIKEFWLGRCAFEQDLFDEARAYFQEYGQLAEKLEDKQARINKQVITEFWLGRCDCKQDLFDKARAHFQKYGQLAEQLEKEQERIQKQATTESWLGYCDFKQNKFDTARTHFQKYGELAKPKINKPLLRLNLAAMCKFQTFSESDEKQVVTQYETYLKEKTEAIKQKLPQDSDDELKTAIAQILAVLNISPIELHIPLAHYTTPTVCEKLLGLENHDPSPMRMNSCTYMNDPTEGQSLLALLNMQDLSLKNKIDFAERKPYNAFFSCFSKRINDLNQFRLYGKEEGVEASGCCLLFNKMGNWLRSSDISSSFALGKTHSQFNEFLDETDEDVSPNKKAAESYPLYQVAYIACDDEYLPQSARKIELENNGRRFFVYLPILFSGSKPDELRENYLKTGLEKLIKSASKNRSENNRALLEYVRYLFKDFAFRDEEEFRTLIVCSLKDEQVKHCDYGGIYVEYGKIHHQIDEIILGTNYEFTNSKRKVEVFRYKLAKSELKLKTKVSHSTLPITQP